jgi:hypothetical protein
MQTLFFSLPVDPVSLPPRSREGIHRINSSYRRGNYGRRTPSSVGNLRETPALVRPGGPLGSEQEKI